MGSFLHGGKETMEQELIRALRLLFGGNLLELG